MKPPKYVIVDVAHHVNDTLYVMVDIVYYDGYPVTFRETRFLGNQALRHYRRKSRQTNRPNRVKLETDVDNILEAIEDFIKRRNLWLSGE